MSTPMMRLRQEQTWIDARMQSPVHIVTYPIMGMKYGLLTVGKEEVHQVALLHVTIRDDSIRITGDLSKVGA